MRAASATGFIDAGPQHRLRKMSGSVVAICGMPGSGKGELNRMAVERGIPVLSMGDMIRAEASARGLSETPSNIGFVAVSLRAEFDEGVLAERMLSHADAAADDHPLVFIEGMRGVAEAVVFRRHWGQRFSVLALESDVEVRWLRISSRGRGEDGERADFETREQRELQWGLGTLIDSAEHHLRNDGSIEALEAEFADWMSDGNA